MRKSIALFFLLTIPALILANEPIRFNKVKFMEQKSDGNADERKTDLYLFDDHILVGRRGKGRVWAKIPFSELEEITYEKSSHPRWKTAIFLTPWALLSKGKKHWLTLEWGNEYCILRLDKNNYRAIIAALEAKTGLEVQWIVEN